jgi:uncharacterized Zn finger protein
VNCPDCGREMRETDRLVRHGFGTTYTEHAVYECPDCGIEQNELEEKKRQAEEDGWERFNRAKDERE